MARGVVVYWRYLLYVIRHKWFVLLECWKVDTGELGPPGYRAIRWIDKSSRRIIRTVLKGLPTQPEYWTLAR